MIALKNEVEGQKKTSSEFILKKEVNQSVTNKNLNNKLKIKTENGNSSILSKIVSNERSKPMLVGKTFQQTSTELNQFKIPKIKKEISSVFIKTEIQTDTTSKETSSPNKKNKEFHKIVRFLVFKFREFTSSLID